MVVTIAAALFLSGCGNDSKEQERLRKEAEYMVNEAYEALKTDTDRFRDGAEPNDDLTMLAVHVSKS